MNMMRRATIYMVCPNGEIREQTREIGVIKKGTSGDGKIEIVYGMMNIGEIMEKQLIDKVKEELEKEKTVIIEVKTGKE